MIRFKSRGGKRRDGEGREWMRADETDDLESKQRFILDFGSHFMWRGRQSKIEKIGNWGRGITTLYTTGLTGKYWTSGTSSL